MAISEEEVCNLVSSLKGSGKTFAEFLADLFKNKCIEIYLGDSYEEVSTEQISTSYPAVFCGKVVSAYRECLIISAAYVDDSKEIKFGNLMFVNERAIRALNEIDGNGIIEEMFLRSKESLIIRDHFAKSR